ncbi:MULTISPECIES: hypothetical protein [Bradyrhizobium]|uniref:hypothetical protein n=1 Tax=Bradyrhizobium TaxID=374 RepID=UPI001EDC72CC|nr:hypothetical protein [Bradyrhizobium zhengyangense]MCG2643809.1 hypothetical protein [Bradyrhizobium zhengyangense]
MEQHDGQIIDDERQLESGIRSTVRSYVKLQNVSALIEMKAHRLELLSKITSDNEFSFGLLRQHCCDDIVAIDAGLHQLMKKETSRGHVDLFSSDKIAGWAQYSRFPEFPVEVEIHFDQELVVRVLSNIYRPDLRTAKIGSGMHGFEVTPPKELYHSSQAIQVKAPNGKVIGEHRKQAIDRESGRT